MRDGTLTRLEYLLAEELLQLLLLTSASQDLGIIPDCRA
jgi:hypothetical protein